MNVIVQVGAWRAEGDGQLSGFGFSCDLGAGFSRVAIGNLGGRVSAPNTALIVSSLFGSPTAINSFVSLWKLMAGVSLSPNIFQPVWMAVVMSSTVIPRSR